MPDPARLDCAGGGCPEMALLLSICAPNQDRVRMNAETHSTFLCVSLEMPLLTNSFALLGLMDSTIGAREDG